MAANPDDVTAQLTFAQMLEDAGRTRRRRSRADEAADQFPDDVRVPFQRGALLEKRKVYTGAEAAFRAALADDPITRRR